MKREEVVALAQLARLELSDELLDRYTHDFSAILEYVAELQKVAGKGSQNDGVGLRDVPGTGLREDHVELSNYRDAIIGQFPKSDDGRVVVPEVISYED